MSITRRQLLAQASALYASVATLKANALSAAEDKVGLKQVFHNDFRIGTAISGSNMEVAYPQYMTTLNREFNAITMENDMKWECIHPHENKWNFSIPDKFVQHGQSQGMYIVGHTLVWHSQVPPWLFKDSISKSGNIIKLDGKKLLTRMHTHISTVAGRYQGKIDAWDVVNEAVDEGKGWRKSPWHNIIGPEYMDYAFHFAHEADPKAHLMYNDYNMHKPAKRDFVVDYIRHCKRKGIPIHGIGLQGHLGLDYPNLSEFEKSIEAYAAEGMRVHITELDIDVLPVAWKHTGAEISQSFKYSKQLNPYVNGLPKQIEQQLTERYTEVFKLLLKHKDKIERITFWGTSDRESWKNNFPVKGRTNYPLLFDRDYQPKNCYHAIAGLKIEAK